MNHEVPQTNPTTANTAGVYRSMNVELGVVGEMHVGDETANISQDVYTGVGRATGVAVLGAESYVDPSLQGKLAARYAMSPAEMHAAYVNATRASRTLLGQEENAKEDEDDENLVRARK